MLRAAKGAWSIERFYESLYDAALAYAAADSVYGFFEEMTEEFSDLRDAYPDLTGRRVRCEERRVAILVSLAHPLDLYPHLVSFSDFSNLRSWISIWAQQPFEEVELEVQDLALRYVIPSFLRDLALGLVQITGAGPPASTGVGRLLEVQRLLEADLADNRRVIGEPNYLVLVYDDLASAYAALGMAENADAYSDRARAAASSAA